MLAGAGRPEATPGVNRMARVLHLVELVIYIGIEATTHCSVLLHLDINLMGMVDAGRGFETKQTPSRTPWARCHGKGFAPNATPSATGARAGRTGVSEVSEGVSDISDGPGFHASYAPRPARVSTKSTRFPRKARALVELLDWQGLGKGRAPEREGFGEGWHCT